MKLIKVLLLDGVTTYSTIREFLKVAKEGDLFICGNLDTEIKPENVKIFIRYDKGRETVSYLQFLASMTVCFLGVLKEPCHPQGQSPQALIPRNGR
ncbi:MAG: hypothetical protein EZS28_054955, partial [Streblomastix strix]